MAGRVDHEPSRVVGLANSYCDALQQIADRAQRELFEPVSEQMLVHGDELDALVACHQHLQALAELVACHVDCLAEMLTDSVNEFGGSVVTDDGLAITVHGRGVFEAVELVDPNENI